MTRLLLSWMVLAAFAFTTFSSRADARDCCRRRRCCCDCSGSMVSGEASVVSSEAKPAAKEPGSSGSANAAAAAPASNATATSTECSQVIAQLKTYADQVAAKCGVPSTSPNSGAMSNPRVEKLNKKLEDIFDRLIDKAIDRVLPINPGDIAALLEAQPGASKPTPIAPPPPPAPGAGAKSVEQLLMDMEKRLNARIDAIEARLPPKTQ